MDDIWYVDYRTINKEFGYVCKRKIEGPTIFHLAGRVFLVNMYAFILRMKGAIKK
jgi:hypothetical protein